MKKHNYRRMLEEMDEERRRRARDNVGVKENLEIPLCTASDKGHIDVVKTLIEAGANVNQLDKNECSPLYLASSKGHLDVVKTLIEAGANVDQATKDGLCPLYSASRCGHLDVVKARTILL